MQICLAYQLSGLSVLICIKLIKLYKNEIIQKIRAKRESGLTAVRLKRDPPVACASTLTVINFMFINRSGKTSFKMLLKLHKYIKKIYVYTCIYFLHPMISFIFCFIVKEFLAKAKEEFNKKWEEPASVSMSVIGLNTLSWIYLVIQLLIFLNVIMSFLPI